MIEQKLTYSQSNLKNNDINNSKFFNVAVVMWITILCVFAVLIAIGYRLFLSTDDDIPTSADEKPEHLGFKQSHFKPIKQNIVAIRALPQSVNTSSLLQSMSMTLANHNTSSTNRFIHHVPRKHFIDSFIQQQKFTRFEQILEYPELVSFQDLKYNYHFGVHPLSTLHFVLCIFLFSFVLLFRLILWFFEGLGYLFFHIFIRFIFECLIRGLFLVIRGIFSFIGALFDHA